MSESGAWHFEWRRGIDEIDDGAFAVQWQEIVDGCGEASVFGEHQMVRAWLQTKGAALGVTPCFCLAEGPLGCRVVLPLCVWPCGLRNGWRRRAVPAGEPHFDYQDPVACCPSGDAPAWQDFWAAFSEEVRTNVTWFEFFAAFRLRAPMAPAGAETDDVQESPHIETASYGSLDELLAGKSKKHRGDVRRQQRRLAEQGDLDLRVFDARSGRAAIEELNAMAEAYERLHADTPSAGLFRMAGTMDFYRRLLSELLPAGLVHFSVLRVGGRPVSWHLGFLHRGVLHYYKPTYEADLANYSPGKVHFALLIEEAIAKGWRTVDLGGGTEAYKFRWADGTVPLKRVQWRTGTLRSAACHWIRKAAQMVSRPATVSTSAQGQGGGRA